MESQVILEIIAVHNSDSIYWCDVFVTLVGITFTLTNFFKVLIDLTAQVSPQTINEKILMMNLDFDNNLRAIVQLCQDVYTGIEILR